MTHTSIKYPAPSMHAPTFRNSGYKFLLALLASAALAACSTEDTTQEAEASKPTVTPPPSSEASTPAPSTSAEIDEIATATTATTDTSDQPEAADADAAHNYTDAYSLGYLQGGQMRAQFTRNYTQGEAIVRGVADSLQQLPANLQDATGKPVDEGALDQLAQEFLRDQEKALEGVEPNSNTQLDVGTADSAYALGYLQGSLMSPGEEQDYNAEALLAGLADGLLEKLAVDEGGNTLSAETVEAAAQRYSQVLALMQEEAMANAVDINKQLGKEALATFAAEGATVLESGLHILVEQEGTGDAIANDNDVVTVHYEGSLVDGSVFDSSIQRGEPIDFPINGVIPGFSEGLRQLKVGGSAKIGIPSDLGYGDGGQGPIPPGATLFFRIELLGVKSQ